MEEDLAMTHGSDRDIPNTYATVPPGFTEDDATQADLVEAGFERSDLGADAAGQQPLDEMLVEGPQEIEPGVAAQLLRHSKVRVLRDSVGVIVATWDEGRWWTPTESAEFLRQIVAEMRGQGPAPPNRAERRRAKRKQR